MHSNIYLELAKTTEIKQEVYALRYRAYRSADAILPNPQELFSDEYDDLPNSYSYLLCKNDLTAIGTIRACVYSPQSNNKIPAFDLYYDEIKTHIGLDKIIVESNRYAIDPNFQTSRRYNIFLFKAIYLQLVITNADYVITAVRKKHIPFYRKILKMLPITTEKTYPHLNVPMVLLAGSAQDVCQNLIKYFPFIQSQLKEIKEYKKCGILRF